MYDALTQEQKWGYEYAALLRNTNAVNGRTNWTPQEIAAERMATAGTDYWNGAVEAKNNLMKTAFLAASPEVQAQVQSLLGVPNILG